jgi:hypothetical protein
VEEKLSGRMIQGGLYNENPKIKMSSKKLSLHEYKKERLNGFKISLQQ